LGQKNPAAHTAQKAWPVDGLKYPTAQVVQLDEIELAWNMPAPQLVHTPADAPA